MELTAEVEHFGSLESEAVFVVKEDWSTERAEAVLRSLPSDERLMLPALQKIQKVFGWVSEEAIDLVAADLNVTRAEVFGVLTYYHDLRRYPPPKVFVQVCIAEACQSVGSRQLVHDLETEFGVQLDETSEDVALGSAYCLGNCALGPTVRVGAYLVGRCDVQQARSTVERVWQESR